MIALIRSLRTGVIPATKRLSVPFKYRIYKTLIRLSDGIL